MCDTDAECVRGVSCRSGVSGVSSVFKKVQWVLSLFVVKIQKKEKEGGESSTQINKSNQIKYDREPRGQFEELQAVYVCLKRVTFDDRQLCVIKAVIRMIQKQ
jgi:hypothetical protein